MGLHIDWKNFGHVAELLAGPALVALGVPPQLAGTVVAGIQEANALAVPGADKKAHVVALASDAIEGYNATAVVKVDAEATLVAVSAGIDASVAVVKIVNQIHAEQAAAALATVAPVVVVEKVRPLAGVPVINPPTVEKPNVLG